MNILQIPDEHVAFGLQRFLNIACFIGQKGNRYLVVGDKEYGAVPRDGSVFLTYEDKVTKHRSVWELVVPVDWYGDNQLDLIKGDVISEQQFVVAFHEFIDDYAE
jgi:hypothetical protein